MEMNQTTEKKLKNKKILKEEFNVRETQCYHVSVRMNHHQA